MYVPAEYDEIKQKSQNGLLSKRKYLDPRNESSIVYKSCDD